MTNPKHSASAMVAYLHRQAEQARNAGQVMRSQPVKATQVLAELRRGWTDASARPRMERYIAAFLPDEKLSARDEWFFVVASLFAFHQPYVMKRIGSDSQNGKDISLGSTCGGLFKAMQSESLEQRFLNLLGSDAREAPRHLFQIVSILRAQEAAINWKALLLDVLYWEAEERPTQRRWARDFYRAFGGHNDLADNRDTEDQAVDGEA